jgi:uncharacterized protein
MGGTETQRSMWQRFWQLDPVTKTTGVGLGLISLGVLGWLGWSLWRQGQPTKLVIAAGPHKGGSYMLAKAIEKVVEAEDPKIQIDVQETKGTDENIARIEQRQADLATAQADASPGANARSVAVLYSDVFQLLVQGDTEIKSFLDLKGKRIGLRSKGGQYDSFIKVANHFGLSHKDFEFVGENDEIVDSAFQTRIVDAVFLVRALGNQRVVNLTQNFNARLVPIEQAEAMRVNNPAFEVSQIPQGVYKGSNPAVPSTDLPTVSIQRLFLAQKNTNPEVVKKITTIINERRRELKEAIPPEHGSVAALVSNIRRPELGNGSAVPLHSGALSYYDRNEPSIIQKNADLIALGLTIGALIWSWIQELKNWAGRNQKDLAYTYIERVIETTNACKEGKTSLSNALIQLDQTFSAVSAELVAGNITQESFQTFNDIYRTMRSMLISHSEVNHGAMR